MAIFNCADCGHSQKTDDKNIGKQTACPKCKKPGRIEPESNIEKPESFEGVNNWETITPPVPSIPPVPSAHRQPEPAPQSSNKFQFWALLIVAGMFTACTAIIGVGAILFFVSLRDAESAIQQGAVGAVFAAGFVAVYVFARCIEKVLLAVTASLSVERTGGRSQ